MRPNSLAALAMAGGDGVAIGEIHFNDESFRACGTGELGGFFQLIERARGQNEFVSLARASANAQALPMPRLAPVINAVRTFMIPSHHNGCT